MSNYDLLEELYDREMWRGEMWSKEYCSQARWSDPVNAGICDRVFYSPFLVAMAAGTLSPETFQQFHCQEYPILTTLIELFESYSLLMKESGLQDMKTLTLERRALHKVVPSENDISISTRRYTKFLRAMCKTKDVMKFLAAVIPALRIYNMVAQKMKRDIKGKAHANVQAWIDMYGSEDFEVVLQQTEYLIDCIPGSRDCPLSKVYRQACHFLVDMFFSVHISLKLCPLDEVCPGFHMVLSFEPPCSDDEQHSGSILKFFQVGGDIERIAIELCMNTHSCVKKIIPLFGQKSFSVEFLQERLDELNLMEMNASATILNPKVLLSIDHCSYDVFCRSFYFESDAAIDLLGEMGSTATVLSSFFCGVNILMELFASNKLQKVGFDGNMVYFDDQRKCTGWRKVSNLGESHNIGGGFTVFISDSPCDLLNLTKANIGIAISPSEDFLKLGIQCGLTFLPILDGIIRKTEEATSWLPCSGVLYIAKDWVDVCTFFYGNKVINRPAADSEENQRISITFADPKTHKQVPFESVPLFRSQENISGKISIEPIQGIIVEHNGVKVELLGQIEMYFDRGKVYDFTKLVRELDVPGEIYERKTYPFEFSSVEMPYETYNGLSVRLRYVLKVTVSRGCGGSKVEYQDFVVRNYTPPPSINNSIKMKIKVKDQLCFESEYNKSKYHLKDVVIGKVNFLLVRMNIKNVNLEIRREESTGSEPNTHLETVTLAKFELMDGAPVIGETIPIKLFLCPYELTPTHCNINNKFSVKYYLKLVLVDEKDQKFFRQREITLYRLEETS